MILEEDLKPQVGRWGEDDYEVYAAGMPAGVEASLCDQQLDGRKQRAQRGQGGPRWLAGPGYGHTVGRRGQKEG